MAYFGEGGSAYCPKIIVKSNDSRVLTGDVYGVQAISVGKNASLVAIGLQMFRGVSTITVSSDSLFEAECLDGATYGGNLKISIGKNSALTVADDVSYVSSFSCKDNGIVSVSGKFIGAGAVSSISIGADSSATFASIDFRNAAGRISIGSNAVFSTDGIRSLSSLTVKSGLSEGGTQNWSIVNLGAVSLRGAARMTVGDFSQVTLNGIQGGQSVKLNIGSNSSFDASNGRLCNVSSMKMASGTIYFENSGSGTAVVRGTTMLYADSITGTKGSNSYVIGDFCSVNLSGIDFVGGSKNKLTLGFGSQCAVTASGSGMGTISKINTLTLKAGTYVDNASMSVEGNLEFSGSAVLSLGSFAMLDVSGDVSVSTSLSVAVGAYAQWYAGDVSNVRKMVLTGGFKSTGVSEESLPKTSINLGSVTGTKNSDAWVINENCDVNINGLDFRGGTKNTLYLAANSTFYVLGRSDSTGSIENVKSVEIAGGSAQRNALMMVDGNMTFTAKVNGSLSVGKYAFVSVMGDVIAGDKGTLTVKVGASAQFEAGSLSGLYALTVEGGASIRSGVEMIQEYTLVQIGDILGTAKDNTYLFGAHCDVVTGNIDFVGGRKNRLTFGMCSSVRTGNVVGVNQLSVLSGTVSRASGGIEYSTLNVDGNLSFSSTSKSFAEMNIGSYVKVTIAGNVTCDFTDLSKKNSGTYYYAEIVPLYSDYFVSGEASVSMGHHTDFVVIGDFSSSVSVSTGKNCRVGLNSTMYKTFAPRTFEGYIYHIMTQDYATQDSSTASISGDSYEPVFPIGRTNNFNLGEGSVMYDLGTETQIVHFTDFDDELLDNKLSSLITRDSGYNGWVSATGAEKQKIKETTYYAQYSYEINYYNDLTDFLQLTDVTAGKETSSLNGWKVLSGDSDLLSVRVHLKNGSAWTATDITCTDGVWDLGSAISDAMMAAAADYRIEISMNDKVQQGGGGVAVYQLKK